MCTRIPLLVIVKVLAPIIENELLMLPLMDSIAVKIPTNAIIPKAIIKIVRIVRKGLERIAFNDILKFSRSRAPYFITMLFN
jgi:hypothetical protein